LNLTKELNWLILLERLFSSITLGSLYIPLRRKLERRRHYTPFLEKYPNLVKEKIKKLEKDLDQCKVAALCAIAHEHPELIFEQIPKLKGTLNDPDGLICERAAAALGNIGMKYPQLIEDIIPKLVELLIDEYPDVREVTYNVLDDLIEKHPKTIEKIVSN